jgi:hypothetical protein
MKSLIYTSLVIIVAFNLSCLNRSTSFGKVNSVTGDVSVFSTKDNKWNPIEKSNTIHFGDTLQSNKGSAEISFRNKSKLTLEPNTKVVILDSVDKKNTYIFPVVFSGGIMSEVKHRQPNDFIYIVYTPVAFAQAKGSHFYVSHTPSTNRSNVQVFDGDVIVYNTTDFSEPVQLSPGYSTTISYSNPPVKPVKLKYAQFRRIGYMFTPEDCEHYEVVFGFPVAPIPVQVQIFASTPVVVNEEEPVEATVPDNYEPEPQPSHNDHGTRSNVSVNINVDGQLPFLPVPFLPVPVPLPGGPSPRHGFHNGPGFAPPLPVPFPGPNHRPNCNNHDWNHQRDDWNHHQDDLNHQRDDWNHHQDDLNRQRDEQNRQRDEQNRQRDEQNRRRAEHNR